MGRERTLRENGSWAADEDGPGGEEHECQSNDTPIGDRGDEEQVVAGVVLAAGVVVAQARRARAAEDRAGEAVAGFFGEVLATAVGEAAGGLADLEVGELDDVDRRTVVEDETPGAIPI